MAVSLTYALNGTVVETLSTNVPAISASDNAITHSGYNLAGNLTASTTPPVTKCVVQSQALSGGSATWDLTAMTGTQGAVDFSGLKVQFLKVENPAGNAAMTFTEGASNGYELAGNTWKVILLAGQHFAFYGNDATPDVSGSTKTIDVTGTGTQACKVILVAG